APNRRVILGIRHTAIPIVQNGAAEDSADAVPAEIYTVEPTGDVTFVHVRVGQHLLVSSTNDLRFNARIGERVGIVFDESHVHLFDAETTKTLLH
ncbi:MAG: hypothetical protein CUN53_09960, partial [Phototrophicales bacterium]